MTGEQQNVFRAIEAELRALREFIVANDLARIKQHTTAAAELLVRLEPILRGSQTKTSWQELQSLHSAARNVSVLLCKARRKVHALLAVYHSFPESPPHAFLEPR